MPRKTMKTHYETLGISKEASAERIKRSYRTLVKIYHPDKFASGSEAQAEAEKQMRNINVAYAVLSKPLSRASYDAKLSELSFRHPEVEPEHCAKCGKPTGYWHSLRNMALCPVCTR